MATSATDSFPGIFDRLRAIMLEAAAGQVVAVDEPGNLVVRTADTDPKTGQPGWFGTVTIKKSYVAYHLMPLYTDAALEAAIPASLAPRRQGKTCFNFKKPDEALFADLLALSKAASDR